ncbi:uncharacterized protein LOC127532951 [Acanthochromis polyacanthus]|uniref:uncharacterized protein LOC127532951 n=1 Tax=Acanthochromis polyacanthus TaxID=80966 RepID=UPI0022346EC1|nr:uncharacterized protein LOC127532951 [Acanthochromis polyacanthus]
MKHNVSWSFAVPLIDIFLDIFLPPQESPYTHPDPECQSLPNVPFQRSGSETKNYTESSYSIHCDRRELAKLNDTMCADVLAVSGKGFSASVFTFCQALSSLNPDQTERMWRNMCYVFQALMSPLMSGSPECSDEKTQAFTAVTPLSQARPVSRSAPHRVAREASNLQQLACNYNSWLESSAVDPVLVSLCSDNERVEFVRQVCSNVLLMRKLLSDRMNSWMYGYCANSSADPGYMVSQFCVYQQWLLQPEVPLDHYLFEFCMNLDGPRLTQLICEHTGFLMILISNPDNWPLMPNCTSAPPPPPLPHEDTLQLESCRYSEWHDVMQVTTDLLSQCILFDQSGFTRDVCSNKTFLDSLLQNAENAWLEGHCDSSLQFAPPEPTPSFNIAGWCDYQAWGERQVDDSVVGLCWQHDQLAFQKNVCCKALVFENLLENPKNQWLTSVCTDIEEITVMPQVCKYSEWTRPIVVDMTELALCAEIDPLNFTSKVCANETVLQNLLTNQDNTWLIQHCFNHTGLGVSPGGGGGGGGAGGGGLPGFDPAEQCQYSTWTIAPPDAVLLTLCWEHDQSNFVSSICPNAALILFLSGEPSSAWVGSMCTTYTNYTTPNNGTTTDPVTCPAVNLMKQLNWNCSSYFASACKPCATQNMAMQMIVRCWVENLRFRLEDLLTLPVARVLDQAVGTTVVVLLILEDVQSSMWHVSETIRESVLNSVVEFLKRETNADEKRVLLQCFGTALTNLLLSTREANSDEFPLVTAYVQEYFNMQLSSLRPVLSAAHISTVRLILRYYSRIMDTVQLSDEYLSTMVSVLLKIHLEADVDLFSELVPLLTAASPADIQALPSLQNNINVRETINENLGSMTLAQQQAFGLWYSKVLPPSEIIRGHQSLIRDTGNLIAYLPFQNFQHLSPAQLLDGLDVLQRNALTTLKQEFIARSLIGTYRNLTAQDFARLGNIACLAEPEDLLLYKNTEAFSVIRGSVINCTHQGLRLPSHLLSNLFLNSSELRAPSSLSAERLTELAPVLPALGVTFLQSLTTSQLLDVLPVLNSVSFSSAQVEE